MMLFRLPRSACFAVPKSYHSRESATIARSYSPAKDHISSSNPHGVEFHSMQASGNHGAGDISSTLAVLLAAGDLAFMALEVPDRLVRG
jgi:hypothetical protein